MEVGRLYDIELRWYRILRLWSKETIFSDAESEEGKRLTLERLEAHRKEIDTVITELKTELETYEWLA